MKGKTGKPNAMRGGGIARKGIGMALKGGGIARKGTGSNVTPGGKVKKMAMGGKPGEAAMAQAEALRSNYGPAGGRNAAPNQPGIGVGRGPSVDNRDRPQRALGAMTRPGFMSEPGMARGILRAYAEGGSVKMTAGSGSGSGRLEKVAAHKAAKRIPATGLKKGGKVKGK